MLRQKERAAGAAPKSELRFKSYRGHALQSTGNLKYDIGKLLFCLQFPIGQELSQVGWGLLERLLRRYVAAQGGCHD